MEIPEPSSRSQSRIRIRGKALDPSYDQELEDWARSGTNATGVKLYKGPWAKTLSELQASSSVVIVVQEAGSLENHVWRHGPDADKIRFLRDTARETASGLVIIPVHWFGAMEDELDEEIGLEDDRKVAFSGASIALSMALRTFEVRKANHEGIRKQLRAEMKSNFKSETETSDHLHSETKEALKAAGINFPRKTCCGA
ncbi:unnamed protein product [Parajaminaea phylloscopi]